MASKKNRSKANLPKAIDDADLVQDLIENEDTVETEPETLLAPGTPPATYLVRNGENILTVADKFKPTGVSRDAYAKTLANLNSTVSPGMVVRLG